MKYELMLRLVDDRWFIDGWLIDALLDVYEQYGLAEAIEVIENRRTLWSI
jgi:hypothetical protein